MRPCGSAPFPQTDAALGRNLRESRPIAALPWRSCGLPDALRPPFSARSRCCSCRLRRAWRSMPPPCEGRSRRPWRGRSGRDERPRGRSHDRHDALRAGRRRAADPRLGREALHDRDRAAPLRHRRPARDDGRRSTATSTPKGRLERRPLPRRRRRPDARPLRGIAAASARARCRDAGVRRGDRVGPRRRVAASTRCRGGPRTGGAYDRDMGGVLGALDARPRLRRRGPAARPSRPRAGSCARLRARAACGSPAATALGEAPPGARRRSPRCARRTMDRLVRAINVPSDNFAAEMLLKDLGAAFGRAGSTAAGRRRRAAHHGARSASTAGHVADGSGLSRAQPRQRRARSSRCSRRCARTGAGRRVRRLARRRRPHGHAAQRACAARRPPARCRGKTGTLNGVSNLAGYCSTRDGHTIAFAMLMNGVGGLARARPSRTASRPRSPATARRPSASASRLLGARQAPERLLALRSPTRPGAPGGPPRRAPRTPSRSAFSSFEPGLSPATT